MENLCKDAGYTGTEQEEVIILSVMLVLWQCPTFSIHYDASVAHRLWQATCTYWQHVDHSQQDTFRMNTFLGVNTCHGLEQGLTGSLCWGVAAAQLPGAAGRRRLSSRCHSCRRLWWPAWPLHRHRNMSIRPDKAWHLAKSLHLFLHSWARLNLQPAACCHPTKAYDRRNWETLM